MGIVLALQTHSNYAYNQFASPNHYFITFNNKMHKSKSLSSNITGTSLTYPDRSPISKFDSKRTGFLISPYPEKHSLKFPKRLIIKPTEMHMLSQTAQINRKPCMRTTPQANRTTMLQQFNFRRQLKQGQFSYLANESPCKPILNRDYSDIGLTHNRRKCNQNQYQSTQIFAAVSQNCESTRPEKITRVTNKKNIGTQVKKNLQWADDKINRSYFQQRYKRCGTRPDLKQNQPQQGYSSIHLKFTANK